MALMKQFCHFEGGGGGNATMIELSVFCSVACLFSRSDNHDTGMSTLLDNLNLFLFRICQVLNSLTKVKGLEIMNIHG